MNQRTNIQFTELMRAGYVAYAQGKRHRAHHIWRRAAMLHPYNEQVWIALLNVLDSEEDRRVCLGNIIAINPNNLQAREQLGDFYLGPTRPMVPIHVNTSLIGEQRHAWPYYLLRVVESLALGVLLAVAISILLYGT